MSEMWVMINGRVIDTNAGRSTDGQLFYLVGENVVHHHGDREDDDDDYNGDDDDDNEDDDDDDDDDDHYKYWESRNDPS